jgi:protein disulfide-isomerase
MNEAPSPAQPPAETESPPDRPAKGSFWPWFWRVFLVISLAYAWHSYYVPSNSIAWAEDFTSAQERAVQSGQPIILFFSATWCVPCRIMKRQVWADDEVTAAVNGAFVPVTVDVDDPDAAAVVGKYGVGVTPNTVIIDLQGNVLRQRAGGMDKAEFLELLGN